MTTDSNGKRESTLRQLRETAGYSLEDLAETCGLTLTELAAIENGTDVNPAKIARVSASLRAAAKRWNIRI